MSLQDCWISFRKANPKFVTSYVSYHYYRSERWTPRYGLKYGTDWILYEKGPTYYHAQYKFFLFCVIFRNAVVVVDSVSSQRDLSWLNILNINRVSEQVKKVKK
jgi:tRNA-splicing endonuclease subunit Sen2